MAKLYALTTLDVDGVHVEEGAEFELADARAAELDLVADGLASKTKPKAEKAEEDE